MVSDWCESGKNGCLIRAGQELEESRHAGPVTLKMCIHDRVSSTAMPWRQAD